MCPSVLQAAYDKVRTARKREAERTQKLDEKRKQMKLDLEARERQAQAQRDEEENKSRSTRTLEQEVCIQAPWHKGCLWGRGGWCGEKDLLFYLSQGLGHAWSHPHIVLAYRWCFPGIFTGEKPGLRSAGKGHPPTLPLSSTPLPHRLNASEKKAPGC